MNNEINEILLKSNENSPEKDYGQAKPVSVDLGAITVKFYPLMKSEVENIQIKRDSVAFDKIIFFSCLSTLFSLGQILIIDGFSSLSSTSKSIISILMTASIVFAILFAIKWYKDNKNVESYVKEKLDEVETSAELLETKE